MNEGDESDRNPVESSGFDDPRQGMTSRSTWRSRDRDRGHQRKQGESDDLCRAVGAGEDEETHEREQRSGGFKPDECAAPRDGLVICGDSQLVPGRLPEYHRRRDITRRRPVLRAGREPVDGDETVALADTGCPGRTSGVNPGDSGNAVFEIDVDPGANTAPPPHPSRNRREHVDAGQNEPQHLEDPATGHGIAPRSGNCDSPSQSIRSPR